MKMLKFIIVGLIAITLFLPAVCFSQDPKGVYPMPAGTDAVIWYYRNISGHEVFVDGNKAGDVSLDSNLAIARFVHWGKLGSSNWTWTVNGIIPYGSLHLEQPSKKIDQTSTGFGDPMFVVGGYTPMGPQGLQAILLEYISIPAGEYDSAKAVNMGNNRWAFRTEFGLAWKPIPKLTLELIGDYEIFTENDDYIKGNNLERDPLYSVFAHVSWDFTKDLFMTLTPQWTWGGETQLNGRDVAFSKVDTKSGWFTVGVRLTQNSQLLLQYVHDFDVENGIPQDQIRFRYAYLF